MNDTAVDAHERSDLGPYVLGALGAQENEPFERHLAVCDECRSEVDTLAVVVVTFALFSTEERRLVEGELG